MHKKVRTIITRGFPILQWLPNYDAEKGISDLVAGITVGLTLIPQSLAYAALAGLSPEYGLYSSLCGGFIYTIFGTIPQLNIAPTALLSLLTFSYTHDSNFGAVPAAILLCFFSGVIEVICGLLHLGFLIDFVSTPVVAGFTSAGAITIASAQVKNLLGLKFSAENFIDVWTHVINQITETKKWDAVLSVCCCVILLGFRQIKDFGTAPLSGSSEKETKKTSNPFKVLIWFLSVSRNAIVVIGCAVAAFIFDLHDMTPFSLTTKVQSGLPPVALPPFQVSTENRTYEFIDTAKELGSGIVVVPFIAILGNVAIAKAFAQGKVVDASQEMLAVGLCNIAGSFFSSMPVCASFSRAAVSNASGTRTSIGGIYTGIMVILSLTFLTPYFSYIPKATLASVIICAVLFMVEVSIIKPIWKTNKIDWIPLWGTFIACLLLGIEYGILIGVAIDILILLYYNARPNVETIKISDNGMEYLKVTPNSAVLFPSAEYVRETIMKSNMKVGSNISYVVVDCSRISRADFTSAKCISALAVDLQKIDKHLILLKSKPKLAQILNETCNTPSCKMVAEDDDLMDVLKGLPTTHASQIHRTGSDWKIHPLYIEMALLCPSIIAPQIEMKQKPAPSCRYENVCCKLKRKEYDVYLISTLE